MHIVTYVISLTYVNQPPQTSSCSTRATCDICRLHLCTACR